MLGIVKEISGQKTIIPLTTDIGTGGRYTLTASRTSNGWSATKDLSNLPVGIYKVTAMHSSSGAITEALVLRTGYDYIVQDTYKTGSIGVSCSSDVLTVSETTSSVGVVVVSLNIVGTKI